MTSVEPVAVNLAGKVAIVTGAAKGIGAAIARSLSAAQARVVVSDINDESGRKLVGQLGGDDKKAAYVRADVSRAADIDNLFRATLGHFSKVDILVNNVGIRYRKSILEIADEEWDRVIATNLSGTFRCIQRATRLMAQQKSGTIINISSQAGVFYSRGQGCHYAASKAAIIQLTRVLSFELGPLGIRINSIAPGSLSLEPNSETAVIPPPRPLENVPLGRLGSAEDVARAVLFFASDQSQFITGQTLLVNGGVIV
jgi:NAD(P)-dependent dehydrogenase (short-subunit alcohol dehydrogenase family)